MSRNVSDFRDNSWECFFWDKYWKYFILNVRVEKFLNIRLSYLMYLKKFQQSSYIYHIFSTRTLDSRKWIISRNSRVFERFLLTACKKQISSRPCVLVYIQKPPFPSCTDVSIYFHLSCTCIVSRRSSIRLELFRNWRARDMSSC